MAKFLKTQSLASFMGLSAMSMVFRMTGCFCIEDLLAHKQRFSMRALKGIRKKDARKLKTNLVIAFSRLMSVVNRLHIDPDDAVWGRFFYLCLYCGKKPCAYKVIKPKKRAKITKNSLRPATLKEYQKIFFMIYPPKSRGLEMIYYKIRARIFFIAAYSS